MTDPSPYPRPYGSYLLLEPLGQGGMSEVELARKAVDDARYVRFVVIKRIHARHTAEPGFIRMFQDEARINAELQHENIAQVYDFGHVGDEWYLAMEYVPGLDLRGVVRRIEDRSQRLPVPIIARIVCDVLRALQYAHARVDTYGRPMNIVHRDVNPRNVMLSVRGEVKLIDFGVAKADTRSEHTQGEVIKGKFAYMAPEQIEAGGGVDGRADLFAVGLMLYELLAGEHPFAGLREIQIVHRVLAGRIPVLPSAPGDNDPVRLRAVIRRALAMNPEDRFPDADAFRTALEAAAADYGGPASGPDLAAFVRALDPGRAEGISERLEAWRDLEQPAGTPLPTPAIDSGLSTAPVPPAPPEIDPPDTSEGTLAEPRQTRLRRMPWVVAGGAAMATGLALVGGLMVALWLPGSGAPDRQVLPQGDGAKATSPGPAREKVPDGSPEAAPPVEPGQPPVTRRTSSPVAAARVTAPAPQPSARKQPTASASTPAPAPAPAPATATAPTTATAPPPTPTPRPAPAAESRPAMPEDGAQPDPVAEDAILFVRSAENGRTVWIDGERAGETPLKTRVTVGPHEIRVEDPVTGSSWVQTITAEKTRRNYHDIGE